MESYICNSIFPLIFQLEKSIAQKEKKKKKLDGLPERTVPFRVKDRFNSKSLCPQALHWDML